MNIVVYGNCQRFGVERILKEMLGEGNSIHAFSNSEFAGTTLDNNKMNSLFENADIIVFQPLTDKHFFSETKIRSYAAKCIAFPYFFNSGYASLAYAPAAKLNSYGKLYSEGVLLDLFEKCSLNDVLKLYKLGKIDFDLERRFKNCLEEMQSREQNCEVKLSDYINKYYRKTLLFVSLNHPTFPIFAEIGNQICNMLGHTITPPVKWLNEYSYHSSITPISPHDVAIHGYEFGFHSNWYERGSELIKMVYNAQIRKCIQTPLESPSPLLLPDSTIHRLYEDKKDNLVSLTFAADSSEGAAAVSISEHVAAGGTYDPSILSFLQSVEIKHAQFSIKLSKYYLKLGDSASAQSILKRAVNKFPNSHKIKLQLGQTLIQLGENQNASIVLKQATDLCPNNSWCHYYLGVALFKLSHFHNAEQEFIKSTSLNSKVAAPYLKLYKIYMDRGEYGVALTMIQKGLELKPDSNAFHQKMRACLLKMKRS